MNIEENKLHELVASGEEIPILDLAPYLAGEPGALDALATDLRHAQQDVGFYFAINHGVPRELIRRGYDALRRLFALPEQEKLKLRVNKSGLGYIPPKSSLYVTSTVNKNTMPDLNEVILTARERPADHPSRVAQRRFCGPNQWPDEALVPGYRATMLEYYAAMEALGYKMLPVYARALDLPADYFTPFFKDPTWTTRNAHYPAAQERAEGNQFGIAPHRDHGFITLLPLSDEPGLQIQTRDGKWLPANIVKDAIIINTGEFLNRWSNGRFMATPHRVVPPKRDRYSIAFFFNPTWDVVSEPLPTCVGPDNPPKFEPGTFLDYLCWYVDSNFSAAGGGKRSESVAAE